MICVEFKTAPVTGIHLFGVSIGFIIELIPSGFETNARGNW